MEQLNHYVEIYKQQLHKGDIQIAYEHLVKYVLKLRTDCIKNLSDRYTFTGVLHGYMDYTYCYYTNDYLKGKKLKLGVVLNHLDMRFEIWLLGNTIQIQKEYWALLKTSKWNKDRKEMPKYAILEVVIEPEPDFDDLPLLTKKIQTNLINVSDEIINALNMLS